MKTLKILIYGIVITFILWVVFSWADIISDNNTSNPQHSDLNFFNLFCCEEVE